MIYIRRKGSDTWHWLCPVAQKLKRTDTVKALNRGRPKGDLCNLCLRLERRGK